MEPTIAEIADSYGPWRARLQAYQTKGKVLPADPQAPEPGTYRVRLSGKWVPVQIWHKLDQFTGEVQIMFSVNGVVSQAQNWPSVWPRCAETPVTPAAYRFYQENKRWPDDVMPHTADGGNFQGAPTHERIQANLSSLEREAICWFESIGSMVSSQDYADRAANFAQAFLELEKTTRAELKAEICPLTVEIMEARTKWAPIEARAREIKRTIKQGWLLPWFQAGASKAGSSDGANRIALTTRHFVAFTDLAAFLKWAVENEPEGKLVGLTRAAMVIARRALRNDQEPPGVEAKETDMVI